MTIVFFISGHGFGHASRQVEIINALGALAPGARVVLRTAVSPALLARTIRVPYELRPGACDSGVIQRTSVQHDDEATVEAALAFYGDFDRRIDEDVAALESAGVAAIVGDIPPLAFEVAARLGVPSVAISNFTWDWIYETHPGLPEAAPWLLPRIRAAYRKATLALELPFSGGFEVFPVVQRLPLVARKPAHSREMTRAYFGVPADRPAILLSFGGYGMPSLDVSRVDCPDWTLVMTDRIQPSDPRTGVPRVVHIQERQFLGGPYRYEDLIAAADVVLTKPGYGIVSECVVCQAPMLYTSRGVFREYDVFVRDMPRYIRCRFIDQTDLFEGRWRAALDELLAQPAPPESMAGDGAAAAARIIRRMLSGD